MQNKLTLENVVLSNVQALKLLDACESITELTFGMVLGVDGSKFELKNKFRKLTILKILSPDCDDCIAFYRKLINHLIKNNALKRLKEIHVEARNASSLFTEVHWQLLENAYFKKSISKELIIIKKHKLETRQT